SSDPPRLVAVDVSIMRAPVLRVIVAHLSALYRARGRITGDRSLMDRRPSRMHNAGAYSLHQGDARPCIAPQQGVKEHVSTGWRYRSDGPAAGPAAHKGLGHRAA